MHTRTNASPKLGTVVGFVLGFSALGCSADTSSKPIVGSGNVIESTTNADIVKRVSISLPFRAEIFNGEPKKLLLSGEDNLLDQIKIEETVVGAWSISAPGNLAFEQHDDMRVAIPYVDMVELQLDGDDIVLKDHPSDYWRDTPDGS